MDNNRDNRVEQHANDWWKAICNTSNSLMKTAMVTRVEIARHPEEMYF